MTTGALLIHIAAAHAARLFETAHPFAVHRFRTDGRRIFAELSEKDFPDISAHRITADLALGQTVITSIAEPFFLKLEYDAEEVRRWWPMGRERGIVLDAGRSFGKPIEASFGVPTEALFRMVRSGESLERVADWYGVDRNAVTYAIEFEAEWMRKAA